MEKSVNGKIWEKEKVGKGKSWKRKKLEKEKVGKGKINA